MIVPADRHFFNTTAIFDDAKVGDAFETDSGLGGSHTIIFQGKTEEGKYIFLRPAREDWPEATFRYGPDAVLSAVYILLPDSPVFREWNMEIVEVRGIEYAVEMRYGVVWVEDTAGYLKLKRKNWSVAFSKEADDARVIAKISRKRK
jgi:hypothetical protein